MKNNRVHRLFGGWRALPLLATAALAIGHSAQAQLSVGTTGLPVQTFDALPLVTSWSTARVPASGGGAGTYTDAASLDAAVIANTDATTIATVLGSNGTQPPAQDSLARWNSAGFYLQTRATGSDYTPLLATLQNDSGVDQPQIVITYDWNQRNPIPVNESVAGHRVYYSLTGAPGSWVVIPELSTFDNNSLPATLSAVITLPSPWVSGTRLYVLWVDDNGPGSTTNPQEGAHSIDNFTLTFATEPPRIDVQPVGRTNNEYSTITLAVTTGGTGPFTYQWYRNNNPISGATGSSLTVTNQAGSGRTWSTPTDSGDYHVVVNGTLTSSTATVLVNPDTTKPTFQWAIGQTNGAGNTSIRIRLSEQLSDPFNLTNDTIYWTVLEAGGANVLGDVLSAALVGNNEIVLDVVGEPDPTKSYNVEFAYADTPIVDRAETPNSLTVPVTLPLFVHKSTLLDFSSVWKYNDTDVDPGATWMQPGFNDSDAETWATGAGPFDAKRNAAGAAGADCRDTALHNLGPVGTCILLTSPQTATNIITYYFRTTVNYNGGTAPTNVMLVISGKSDDGHVVYLNGTEIDRVGMPSGAITHTTFATRTVGDGDAQDVSYIAYPSTIQNGINTIAVSMHNVNLSSSDATLGLRIEAFSVAPGAAPGPRMTITRDPVSGAITITWAGGGTLQTSTTLAPNSWSNVTGATSPYVITNPQGNAFFRVVQ